jgi:hypothetical protein
VEVLTGIEAVQPHLHWMLRTAPAAIVAGDEVAPPFLP